MRRDFGRSFPAFVGALLIAAGCISVAPGTSTTPVTLAPGATATAAAAATPAPPAVTLAPGATATPATATQAPTDTSQPTTEPPATTPPTDAPDTGPHPDWPVGAIPAGQAVNHVGETGIVCGRVNGANWVFAEPGHPTWLNLGPAYPNQKFNAVIWGEARRQWPVGGKPDVVYLNQVICVTGLIESYSSWTQIQNLTMTDIQVIP